MNAYCIHKGHNAEDVRLKVLPVGHCPKARLGVIASYHAISMLSKQCLDSGFWAVPEFMILNQSCPGYLTTAVPLTARDVKRAHSSTTITRMDAGVEPPWMALRRVNGGCTRFMSRISATIIQAHYINLFG